MDAGIATAEAGLRLAEQQAPQGNTIQATLYETVSKSLAEGKAAEAAQKIKNPGRNISKAESDKRIGQIIKKDTVDNNGQPDQTQEQKNRQKAITDISDAIIHLREKGYTGMTNAEQKTIHDILSDSLYNHPTLREIAESKNIDLTSQSFKDLCNQHARDLLMSNQSPDKLANGLVQVLEGVNIDYSQLLTNIESQKVLNKTVSDLKTEVGNDGVNGQPKDGLHKEVEDKQKVVDGYKTKIIIDPQTALPTVVAESNDPNASAKVKLEAELRLKQSNETVELINATTQDVDRYFDDHPKAKEWKVTDPENTAQVITVKRNNWAVLKTQWNKKNQASEVQKTKDQQLIDKIKEEETVAKAKLTEIEQKLNAKKTELVGKQKELDDLVKKITKEHDVNENGTIANKEQELFEDIKRMIINENLDLWSKGSEAAGKVEPEAIKKLEGEIANESKKRLREVVYNEQKKKFNKKNLNNELTSLLDNKVDGYGMSKLQSLWNDCNAVNAPPELKKYISVIKDIVDFTDPQHPKIINQEKLTTFSTDIVGDLLKQVAYKDPRMLENRFTQDEQAMLKLKGDILPDLIMQAHKDKSLRAEVEKGFGEKLTKGRIREAIARWDWKKILMWLGILAGIGVLVGGIAAFKH